MLRKRPHPVVSALVGEPLEPGIPEEDHPLPKNSTISCKSLQALDVPPICVDGPGSWFRLRWGRDEGHGLQRDTMMGHVNVNALSPDSE